MSFPSCSLSPFLVLVVAIVVTYLQEFQFLPVNGFVVLSNPPRPRPRRDLSLGMVGDFMVKEFSSYEELEEIVRLAAQPIPERPDGIVLVAKFSSTIRQECKPTEADYERLARQNPATIFLRCMEEYENAHILFGQVDVQVWPTYDVFYGGNRVARIQGSNIAELEETLNQYQLQNSNLDLFSEQASASGMAWGDGTKPNMDVTPRTTNRFVPGYDWNKKTGSFDEVGQKAQSSFEEMFGNWIPNIDDDDDKKSN